MTQCMLVPPTIFRGPPHHSRSPSKLGHSRQDAPVTPNKQRVSRGGVGEGPEQMARMEMHKAKNDKESKKG
jgi:hypothetical protein